jgi:hypothetical protein
MERNVRSSVIEVTNGTGINPGSSSPRPSGVMPVRPSYLLSARCLSVPKPISRRESSSSAKRRIHRPIRGPAWPAHRAGGFPAARPPRYDGRKLPFDRATRAVRALSDQQSARSTLPLASTCAQDRLGFLSRFWFWIGRPNAWPHRHTAGIDRPLTLTRSCLRRLPLIGSLLP